MVRSANTGLSCVIDRTGVLRNYFATDPEGRDIYGEGTATWSVQTGAMGADALTFYTRHGDLFALGCTLIVGLGLVPAVAGAIRARRRSVQAEADAAEFEARA